MPRMRVPPWLLFVLATIAAMVVASATAPSGDWEATVQWATQRRTTLVTSGASPLALAPASAATDPAAAYALAARFAAALLDTSDWAAWLEAGGERALTDAERVALSALEPAFTALQAATNVHGAMVASEVDWFEVRTLATALLARARGGEAADEVVAADVATALACAIDLAAVPLPVAQFCGFALLQSVDEAATDAWLGRLTPSARARLAASLAAADAALPVVSELPAAIAVYLVDVLSGDAVLRPESIGLGSAWFAWRHGFSILRDGRARVGGLVAAVRAFEAGAVAGESWPVRASRLRALIWQDRSNNRDLQLPYLHAVLEAEEARRLAATRLRLLRLALALHAGESPPELADPFGDGPLVVVREPGVVCRSPASGVHRSVASGR